MKDYIDLLKLERHVEGGYFCQIYQSADRVRPNSLRYTQLFTNNIVERSACTSIYFLLNGEDFSAWHILRSDEIWHYYDGNSPFTIHIIDENGTLSTHLLGNPRLTSGASFQVIIKAGWWFAAEIKDKKSFALAGCTVSPGFEYQDFFLADKKELSAQFPQHAEIISRLTRNHAKNKTPTALRSKL